MNKRQRLRAELSKLKAALRGGDSSAAHNLAATYRQLGNRRRSFHWWRRASETRGGDDAWLEVGYCRQYGMVCVAMSVSRFRRIERPFKGTTSVITIARRRDIIWRSRYSTGTVGRSLVRKQRNC